MTLQKARAEFRGALAKQLEFGDRPMTTRVRSIPITAGAARLAVALILAVLAVSAVPSDALAECLLSPSFGDDRPTIRYAFTATVTERSADVDPSGVSFDWHVELDVDDVYLGEMPSRLAYNGHDGESGGCHALQAGEFRAGERIFIAVNDFTPRDWLGDPFGDQALAWTWADDHWIFDMDAVPVSYGSEYDSTAAQAADSLPEILAFIGSLPDTSTVTPTEPGRPIGVLTVAFLIGLILSRRLARGQRGTASQP